MSDHENDRQHLHPLEHLAELRAAAEAGRPVWAEPLDAEGALHRSRQAGSVRSSRHGRRRARG